MSLKFLTWSDAIVVRKIHLVVAPNSILAFRDPDSVIQRTVLLAPLEQVDELVRVYVFRWILQLVLHRTQIEAFRLQIHLRVPCLE